MLWNHPSVRESLYLIALAALCFTLQLGSAPLFDGDEGRAAVASWQMWQTGDFLTLAIDGEAQLHQPPLFAWLQAGSSAWFGLDEPAFRAPSALAASIWMLALYAFCRSRMGVSSARAVAIFMAASLAVSIIGRSATPHALMNLWVTFALLDIYRWCERGSSLLLNRAYVWMALGLLTQGFAALILPLSVVSTYLLASRRHADVRRVLLCVPGWVAVLLLASPWYFLMLRHHGELFVDAFFVEQWGGLLPEGNAPVTSSPIEFLGTLPLVVVPFSALALAALWRAGKSWRNPLNRFALIWLGAVLVVFSLPGAELPHQLLLGSTPLFILMARFRESLKNRWLLLAPLIGFALLAVIWPFLLLQRDIDPSDTFRVEANALAAEVFLSPLYLIGAALFFGLSIALCVARRLSNGEALLAAGFLQAWFVGLCLLPSFAESRQLPVKEAARTAAKLELPVVTWASRSPSFSVYRREITEDRLPEPGEWVFTREGRVPLEGAEIAYRRGGYIMLRPSASWSARQLRRTPYEERRDADSK